MRHYFLIVKIILFFTIGLFITVLFSIIILQSSLSSHCLYSIIIVTILSLPLFSYNHHFPIITILSSSSFFHHHHYIIVTILLFYAQKIAAEDTDVSMYKIRQKLLYTLKNYKCITRISMPTLIWQCTEFNNASFTSSVSF